MLKNICLVSLIILCGCSKNNSASCKIEDDDSEVIINISAINDNISEIEVFESFVLPYSLISDENKMNQVYEQIDNDFVLNDNRLTKHYIVDIDEKYSYSLTIANLNKEHFYCE